MKQSFHATTKGTLAMYNKRCVLLLLSMVAMNLHAATPWNLNGHPYKELVPPGLLDAGAQESPYDLHVVSQHTDKKKTAHIRMQQYYQGFLVFGGYAIVHSRHPIKQLREDATHRSARLSGLVYRDLQLDLGQASSKFTKNTTEVLYEFKKRYDGWVISQEKVTPLVFVDEVHQAHWAYQVSFLAQKAHETPKRPTAMIEFNTNKILQEWDEVQAADVPVRGLGFGGNGAMGIYQFGVDKPYLRLTRDPKTATCFMENEHVKVIHVHDHESKNCLRSMQFYCPSPINPNTPDVFITGFSGDGYDWANEAASPTNDALYYGEIIYKMYDDWYDMDILRYPSRLLRGLPLKLVIRVHASADAQAIWDGKEVRIGDGDSSFYPQSSLTILAHEFSHGFTQQHAHLVNFGQAGGLNESFSDMASQAAEYYATGTNTWQIGSDILKPNPESTAVRWMNEPRRGRGRAIDNAKNYLPGMDPHDSSGVYNVLFYRLATQPGWDTHKAFDVMVKANVDYWTPYSTFDQAACGVIFAACDLGYPTKPVRQVLSQTGVEYKHCGFTG